MNPNKAPKKSGCLIGSCFSITTLLLAIVIFLGVSLLFSAQILTGVGSVLIHSDPLEKADAIVVLSGGGLPRLGEAAKLQQENKGGFIILTETGIVTDQYGDLSQIEKNQLAELGVQPSTILITETHVDTTTDEALVIRRLASKNGYKTIIVVTDTFHSMRTRMIFDDTFKGRDINVIIRPVRDDWYKAGTWWKSTQGWQVTLEEYSKLFGYYFEQRLFK